MERQSAEYPSDQCVHQLFEDQVNRTPDAVAVVFKDEKLTYRSSINERISWLTILYSRRRAGDSGWNLCRAVAGFNCWILGYPQIGVPMCPLDPKLSEGKIGIYSGGCTGAVLLTQAQLAPIFLSQVHACVCMDDDWQRSPTSATRT